MTTTHRKPNPVIRVTQSGGQVMVEPNDEDRFVMTAQSAVRACPDRQRQEESIRLFKQEFLTPLMEWCSNNASRVRACYIPVPRGHIQVFMLGTLPRYDFGLSKDLAALELQLADKGWNINILQLPAAEPEELQAFFNPEGALEVYAKLEATP